MNVQFRNRTYAPGEYTLVTVNGIPFARIDVSTRPDCKMTHHIKIDKPVPVPAPVTCTTLAIWRPVIELPIDQLGYYREGKKGIPGVNLTMSNVLIVLTMPEAA
jgi:hypothetical protein